MGVVAEAIELCFQKELEPRLSDLESNDDLPNRMDGFWLRPNQLQGLSGFAMMVSHVMDGFWLRPFQSHGLSGFALTVSHVMAGFWLRSFQSHGLSGFALTTSHEIDGLMLNPPLSHVESSSKRSSTWSTEVTIISSCPVVMQNRNLYAWLGD